MLMRASRTTRPIFSTSAAMKRPNSSAPPDHLGPHVEQPGALRGLGDDAADRGVQPLDRRGRRAGGAEAAVPLSMAKPGSPDSATVGTSGR